MRKIIIIWFLALSLIASGNTYYVAPTGGSDSNPGTLSLPWATPQKALDTADAGDTVFFRGGTYYLTAGLEIIVPSVGNTGTESNPICYFNYPNELPIFDFRNTYPDGNYITGVFIQDANFLRFRGIEIRNVYQRVQDVQAIGLYFAGCNNIYCENVKVHHISGNAIRNLNYFDEINVGYDSTYYINCDAYDNCDTLRINPVNDGDEGNSGDGWKMFTEPSGYIHLEGCRAWRNSDDGFDPTGSYLLVIKNCWSFSNGYLTGDGNGAKIGGNGAATDTTFVPDSTKINAIITNNIFADNHGELGGSGIQIVEQGYYLTNSRIYNNTLYGNDAGFSHSYNSTYDYSLSQYFNNICYLTGAQYSCAYIAPDEQGTNTFIGVAEYPSWTANTDFIVTSADFVSLDVSELESARNSDGSLPIVDFVRLAEGSDLIDRGTNVGLPYTGSAPDLGYSEYGEELFIPLVTPVVSGSRFIIYNGVIVKI
jgi:hypothetical protein